MILFLLDGWNKLIVDCFFFEFVGQYKSIDNGLEGPMTQCLYYLTRINQISRVQRKGSYVILYVNKIGCLWDVFAGRETS